MCRHGWLMLYHGVQDILQASPIKHTLCYSAGAMVLCEEHPNRIIYRSPNPVLSPKARWSVAERSLMWCFLLESIVVTILAILIDLMSIRHGGRSDGVARLDVPPTLPRYAAADHT